MVSSAATELPVRFSPGKFFTEHGESVFVFLFPCLHRGARWLVQRAMLCIEVLETTVACVFSVCAVIHRVQNVIQPVNS